MAADKWDLNYVGLDGNIGCMVNGAGELTLTLALTLPLGRTPTPTFQP